MRILGGFTLANKLINMDPNKNDDINLTTYSFITDDIFTAINK